MKQLLAEEEKERVAREEPQPQCSSSASGSKKVCPATSTIWWTTTGACVTGRQGPAQGISQWGWQVYNSFLWANWKESTASSAS